MVSQKANAGWNRRKQNDSTNSSTSNSTSNPDPVEVTSFSGATGVDKVICLAEALKSQLDATQLATLQRTYSKTEAVKWFNLPQALVAGSNKRVGLNFGATTTA